MISSSSTKPTILVFGGHDPTGGAGIQADIETIGATGGHAATVVTALTVQSSHAVEGFHPTTLDLMIQQGRVVLDDLPIAAIKIGMVGSVEICEAIHTLLNEHPDIPVVLDPVLHGGGGGTLSDDGLVEAIRTLLIPLAAIATPNRSELARLAPEGDSLQACGAELISMGCGSLLVTGTDHPLSGEAPDQVHHLLLQSSGETRHFRQQRLPHHYHGSGCTLSSSIATALAEGKTVEEAATEGLEFTWNSIAHGYQPGSGQHFPDRYRD